MVNILDPNKLENTPASPAEALGQQAELESHLADLEQQIGSLPESASTDSIATIKLEIARTLQLLERGEEAWNFAFTAFGHFQELANWEGAAEACEIMYLANQEDSLIALGQGVWLGVTFPIDPEISIMLLSHIVDDTPDDSDGAAVAAATACYIADIRTSDDTDGERQKFFSQQLLGQVARRHSNIEDQDSFDQWIDKLELNEPDKFLIRLRNVVDVLVQDQWWFDRDNLQNQIPN